MCAALDALGAVAWVVVPNRFHHLHAAATVARYPRARLVGPASVTARNREVAPQLGFDDGALREAVAELTPIPLEGVPFLDETLFFHRASGTLISADLLMSGSACDHWTWRSVARVCGQYGRPKPPPDVRLHTRRGEAVRRSIAQLALLPLEQIFVAHSDPIVERAVEQLSAAWRCATK
jgi:hypothetical protein